MKVFRIPIFSMRSYQTGLYDVSKDGNFQLHVSRSKRGDSIAIPYDCIGLESYLDLGLNFIPMVYGKNAYDTRKHFWDIDKGNVQIVKVFDGIVISDITDYPGGWNFMHYNFNITSHPLIEKPYIDEFLAADVRSINSSIQTTVLNKWQKDWLIDNGALSSKIVVDQRVVNFERIKEFTNQIQAKDVYKWVEYFKDKIFFPFRISDPCYKFDKVVDFAERMGRVVVVTDPNESLQPETHYRFIKYVPTKMEYYTMLMARPKIIYFEDPEFCFHPGLGELIYFGCEIISPYKMPSIDDILIR